MRPVSRGASRGIGPRLLIRVHLRVYLPVDIRGALIGASATCASSFYSHSPPQAKVHCAEFNSSFDSNYK